MRFLQKAVAAVSFGLLAVMAGAAGAAQPGVDYRVLEKPQPTESGKKVEVTEFFWYSCPHCYAFEPSLAEWVRTKGDAIVFKRVPVAFRDSFIPQQKLYYTLEIMGRLDDLHKKVFDAIHAGRQKLDTENAIVDFIAAQGVDKAKFLDIYNSFAVQTKVGRVPQLQQAYAVDGVPLVAIDGRFVTSPTIVSARMRGAPSEALHAATLEVMNTLVASAAKKAPAAPAKPAKAEKKEKPAAKPQAAK